MESQRSVRQGNALVASVAAVVGMLGLGVQPLSAAFVPVTIYATAVNESTGNNGLFALNVTAPNTFTTTKVDSGNYDSLVFDGNGNLLLTSPSGTMTVLGGFDTTLNTFATKTTFLVTNDPVQSLHDITAEPTAVSLAAGITPGHGSALISDMGTGQIFRVDTTTGAATALAGGHNYATNSFSPTGRPGPEGLAYVPNGAASTGYSLIATIGNRNQPGERALAELDPLTGAISSSNIKTGLSYNDGLGYDPGNGMLYSSDRAGVALYVDISPLSLATYVVNEVAFPSDGNGFPVQQPDGVSPDGFGNVYVANYDSIGTPGNIYMYDEAGGTPILAASLPGLDDIAPLVLLPGTGAPTPEPASLAVLGLGALAILARKYRR